MWESKFRWKEAARLDLGGRRPKTASQPASPYQCTTLGEEIRTGKARKGLKPPQVRLTLALGAQ